MGAEDFRLYGDTDEDTDSSAEDESEGFSLKAGGSRGSVDFLAGDMDQILAQLPLVDYS